MMAEPLLMNAPGYSYGVLLCTILGCWVMRRAKSRWPNISNAGLIGVLIVWTFFFDLVMEGLFLMPMGLYIYPGAIRVFVDQCRHLLPMAGVRRADVGRRPSRAVRSALLHRRSWPDICRTRTGTSPRRCLRSSNSPASWPIFAACSMFFFVFYNIPAQWFAMHQDPWPADIVKRSYFLMGICGDGTDRLCPDPAVPIPGKNSGYINPGWQAGASRRREAPDRSFPSTRGSEVLTSQPTRGSLCVASAFLPGGQG